jgi:dihydrofolate synthase/folylpolyglutamate synthase
MNRYTMNWSEIQTELLSYPHRTEKDLSAVYRLDAALDHPHKSFRSIHIGGTNGKGSVSLKIAKSLEKENFVVGLYTSPHIVDLCERIQINGVCINKEDFCEIFEKVKPFAEGCSFFDVLTSIAFLYFQQREVDWAVVEVGLGGRFDATNVIFPELAVITSIGFDHMHILGNTLEEIAHEKAGIVKPQIPLIVGQSASRFFPQAQVASTGNFFDLENRAIAKLALENLSVSKESIAYGLEKMPSCRFEVHGNVVFDVAHNPSGFVCLIEALYFHFPEKTKFRFVVAFSKEKDWRGCLDLLLPHADKIFAAPHSLERLEDPDVLCAHHPMIEKISSMEEILRDDGVTVFCGSFYFMKEARKTIK